MQVVVVAAASQQAALVVLAVEGEAKAQAQTTTPLEQQILAAVAADVTTHSPAANPAVPAS